MRVACCLLCACVCACVGEGRAGQGKAREEVEIIQQNTKTMNRYGDRKKAKNIVQIVGRCRKMQETLGILSKHGLFFGTIWSSVDSNNVRTRTFFSTRCFLHFPWDLSTCSAEGPVQTPPKKHFFTRGPTNHALEKDLTSATPCVYVHILQTHGFNI